MFDEFMLHIAYTNSCWISVFKGFGGDLSVASIIDFINHGGNVLVATSSSVSEFIRDLSIEFSADFDERNTAVFDHFNQVLASSSSSGPVIASSEFVGNDVALLPRSADGSGISKKEDIPPVLFRGVAHRITGKNPLITALLVGSATSYSFDVNESEDTAVHPESPFVGHKVALVSALQARNNARVVFAGSSDMFSDEFINMPVEVAGKKYPKSGNLFFTKEITKWTFHEKGVLAVKHTHHHREDETQQHGIYRIKEKLAYEIEIAEWHSGQWNAFRASDIQFEAVMLDPYIRKGLKMDKSALTPSENPKSTKYVTFFTLPDAYGVFTFKVNYQRHGLTWLEAKETVQVRPYRHDQYPRFLTAAYPYYVNTFSMMAAFVLFSIVWLFNKEVPLKDAKNKLKKT
ncbi:hypothetical protein HK102_005314 [Quaeritorhiza haematococci]|nr:hypothetical protein HK102_005314 [Quaeritorhiza haematococci]